MLDRFFFCVSSCAFAKWFRFAVAPAPATYFVSHCGSSAVAFCARAHIKLIIISLAGAGVDVRMDHGANIRIRFTRNGVDNFVVAIRAHTENMRHKPATESRAHTRLPDVLMLHTVYAIS